MPRPGSEAPTTPAILPEGTPDHADAWRNHGLDLSRQGRLDEALACFEQMATRFPSVSQGHVLRAGTLYRLGRFAEAVDAHEPILGLIGQNAAMTANHAAALLWSGRVEEAMAAFQRAVALDPDYAPAWTNLGLAQLLLGDLPNGFRSIQGGLKARDAIWAARGYPQPRWYGQTSLSGKTLLLHGLQGLGDTIQFSRYASLAIEAGARVVLEVRPRIAGLLRTLPGDPLVIAVGDPVPDFDLHCPIMRMAAVFGTTIDTIPARVPYLRADPARVRFWRGLTPVTPAKRIGLVWVGGSMGPADPVPSDLRRFVTLRTLAPLGRAPGCEFISLQLGPAAAQAAAPGVGISVRDDNDKNVDMHDTAALIETLDLVIGVDTAVVHLAGALGKPVWLLNHFDTDWRWLLDRDDSPWYPTLRQFRQTRSGDWDGVVARAAEALHAFVAGGG